MEYTMIMFTYSQYGRDVMMSKLIKSLLCLFIWLWLTHIELNELWEVMFSPCKRKIMWPQKRLITLISYN